VRGELWRQLVAVAMQVSDELHWNRRLEQLVGLRRPVAAADAEKADFVFHLDHEHGLFGGVALPQMSHQRGESAGVGPGGFLAERRENFEWQALG